MVVRGYEDHIDDVVVGDELEQGVALRAVAADVGLATVRDDRGVGAACAEARDILQCERAAEWPDLVDRVGDGNELPLRACSGCATSKLGPGATVGLVWSNPRSAVSGTMVASPNRIPEQPDSRD
jgi:hypothetical protein